MLSTSWRRSLALLSLVAALSLVAVSAPVDGKMVLKSYLKGYGYAWRYCHKDGKQYFAVSQILFVTRSEGTRAANLLAEKLRSQGFDVSSASFSNRYTGQAEAAAQMETQMSRNATRKTLHFKIDWEQ